MLDNSMILFGSALSDGNSHNPHKLPLVVGGGGGGRLATGQHLVYTEDTPAANLYVSMLDAFGTPVERFADSTGPSRSSRVGRPPQASGLRPIAVFGSTMPFFYRLVASILVLIGTPVLISHPMGNLSIGRYARLDLLTGRNHVDLHPGLAEVPTLALLQGWRVAASDSSGLDRQAEKQAPQWLANLVITQDGIRIAPKLTSSKPSGRRRKRHARTARWHRGGAPRAFRYPAL